MMEGPAGMCQAQFRLVQLRDQVAHQQRHRIPLQMGMVGELVISQMQPLLGVDQDRPGAVEPAVDRRAEFGVARTARIIGVALCRHLRKQDDDEIDAAPGQFFTHGAQMIQAGGIKLKVLADFRSRKCQWSGPVLIHNQ
jgi:hypothetical protein